MLPSSLPFAGCTVLVIEDEPVQALDVEQSLKQLGCTVLGPVASRAEARDLLHRKRPNLALLDMVLRDGIAVPVAEQLVALEVPFAAMAGWDHLLQDHPLLHGVPLLRKPYSPPKLRASVRQLFRIDLTQSLARTDRRITVAWNNIQAQARLISRLAAKGSDTHGAEERLKTYERTLAVLHQRRAHLIQKLERQGGPAVVPHEVCGDACACPRPDPD